jgi:EPS-associated MarR family transcriptional regulator
VAKNNQHTLKEDILNILRLLASKDDLTQRDVSNHLEISLGKTNYLLKSLIKKNLIKARNFSKDRGKLRKVKYILTKKGLEEKVSLMYHFLRKKELEYNHIRNEWNNLKNQINPDNQQEAAGEELSYQLEGGESETK